MKYITPLNILFAFAATIITGRTLELFDNPDDPRFGFIQLFLGLLAAVLFFTYIALLIKNRRKK